MKKLFLLLLLPLAVMADQRFEMDGGYCHFNYDVNNADNEVYFANCKSIIDTHDGVARGHTNVTVKYDTNDRTLPMDLIGSNARTGINLRGAGANSSVYGEELYTVSNATCNMVTANYNAGADDQNETEYTTTDWNMEAKINPKSMTNRTITSTNENGITFTRTVATFKVKYQLACRGGVQ